MKGSTRTTTFLFASLVMSCWYDDGPVFTLYADDEAPFGASMEEWSARWWQWALAIPNDNNPLNGGDCAQGQSGPVWFLAGHGPLDPFSPQQRFCTIPADKALLFPILTSVCFSCPEMYGEDDCIYTEEAALLGCFEGYDDIPTTMTLEIDVDTAKSLDRYLYASEVFTVNYTADGYSWLSDPGIEAECLAPWDDGNVCEVPPGPRNFASIGYWVMVKPLPAGYHWLRFTATQGEGETAMQLDMTYWLRIE